MTPFITKDTPVTDSVLNVIAHLPTKSLDVTVDPAFFAKLSDADFMRIAVLLAKKGQRPLIGISGLLSIDMLLSISASRFANSLQKGTASLYRDFARSFRFAS